MATTRRTWRTSRRQAKTALKADKLEVVADRGYYHSEQIVTCDEAGVTLTMPKRMTSGAKAQGRFGKQDFASLPEEGVYRCLAGEWLTYRYRNIENGLALRRY